MADKFPLERQLNRVKDAAMEALADPRGAAGKALEQAKGTAAFGRMVAEQVGRSAAQKAIVTAGAVAGHAVAGRPGRRTRPAPTHSDAPRAATAPAKKTPAKKVPAKKVSAKKVPAKKTPAE
jgi:hypothetical protein